MNLESNHYIIGLVTEHGVIPLDVGRRSGQIAAQQRAKDIWENLTEQEKNRLQAIQCVAQSVVVDLE
jgi:hypothetical protein